MANYSKSTNFAVKDSLTTGDPNKIVSGVEIDTEFNSLASMSSTKADKIGGATAGNLATLTASGGIQDSGSAVSDLYNTDDLKTDLNASGDMPLYAVRAWVNFNGGTNTIRGSGNVTSVTRPATGDNIINFETEFDDANYSAVGAQDLVDVSNGRIISVRNYTTTSVSTAVRTDAGGRVDASTISVQVVR